MFKAELKTGSKNLLEDMLTVWTSRSALTYEKLKAKCVWVLDFGKCHIKYVIIKRKYLVTESVPF